MNKILFDCDNTMGIKNCDVDDGLALLYLLGSPEVELMGITTTYGNSTLDTVHTNTERMLDDLGMHSLSLHKGSRGPGQLHSEAAEFLVDMATRHEGEITLLATGSLTNLYGACKLNPDFLSKLRAIVLMGGVTEPLYLNNTEIKELNFSCDPEASHKVLNAETDVTVMTGNLCLQARFGEKDLLRLQKYRKDHAIFDYIYGPLVDWYKTNSRKFGIRGFVNWDIVAAVYTTHPFLFDNQMVKVTSTPEDLHTGRLKVSKNGCDGANVNIPAKIRDIERFNNIIFKTWAKFPPKNR